MTFVTCETVAAIVLHIRIVGPEGVRRAGFSERPKSLCGAKVSWDTGIMPGLATCRDCIEEYRKIGD